MTVTISRLPVYATLEAAPDGYRLTSKPLGDAEPEVTLFTGPDAGDRAYVYGRARYAGLHMTRIGEIAATEAVIAAA